MSAKKTSRSGTVKKKAAVQKVVKKSDKGSGRGGTGTFNDQRGGDDVPTSGSGTKKK